MLFGKLKMYFSFGLVLTILGLWGFSYYQTQRVKSLQATNWEYSQKIVDLEAAQELTEKLREDNDKLTAELLNIQTQLKGADGYDTPLPSSIADVLRSVQSESR